MTKHTQPSLDWEDVYDLQFAPCKKCGRCVKSPCHDDEGFYTEGPWDFACDMHFRPWKYDI